MVKFFAIDNNLITKNIGENMDRYTKVVLTVIAVSLVVIIFQDSIITDVKAASEFGHWMDMREVATNVETIMADIQQLKNICSK
jgi:hypothetical protein